MKLRSNFVDELIDDIKNKPETYRDNGGWGVKKDNVEIFGYGNMRLLSIITVKINEKLMPLSFLDRYHLEVAVGNWYKRIKLDILKRI